MCKLFATFALRYLEDYEVLDPLVILGYPWGMQPIPDRGADKNRQSQPLNVVRGGAVCSAGGEGAHVLQGSYTPAVCVPTVGKDTRSRWRDPNHLNVHHVSRHSTHAQQHRGIKTTQRGLAQG